MTDSIPFVPYKLFLLYVEPISALVGAFYAGIRPSEYLGLLTLGHTIDKSTAATPPTATLMSLYQLSNLYLLFALNEHLVLSSTSSLKTWRRLLFCLLVADLGHLATMAPLGRDVYWRVWDWNAMVWGSVGFVYLGAATRICFLAGVGMKDPRTQGTSADKQVCRRE
ncbi:hypothetical protein PUNSTDRAFT_65072 [Punctularia strigosozonata HHB-11173 SS5]|uniref:uncharacterized protein n=1 Tax=Punctularia strigosozonata (strain HHB-11173) TaxID=741275 RepID=UPI00044167C5|nr:uncharacterized protein PUNSTDRAFT_65072 [Punctularia strigosozonata HHB-11173 SS5]EIN11102.1 hypothetical protein PUNSTDRAFT_65072 [Punctularia strigosozonata HHB-11173 SS5]